MLIFMKEGEYCLLKNDQVGNAKYFFDIPCYLSNCYYKLRENIQH